MPAGIFALQAEKEAEKDRARAEKEAEKERQKVGAVQAGARLGGPGTADRAPAARLACR